MLHTGKITWVDPHTPPSYRYSSDQTATPQSEQKGDEDDEDDRTVQGL